MSTYISARAHSVPHADDGGTCTSAMSHLSIYRVLISPAASSYHTHTLSLLSVSVISLLAPNFSPWDVVSGRNDRERNWFGHCGEW